MQTKTYSEIKLFDAAEFLASWSFFSLFSDVSNRKCFFKSYNGLLYLNCSWVNWFHISIFKKIKKKSKKIFKKNQKNFKKKSKKFQKKKKFFQKKNLKK